jgi:hypothetical protein
MDLKSKGAQDSILVNANGGAYFYKQKSFTCCHRMAHKFAQDAAFKKCP